MDSRKNHRSLLESRWGSLFSKLKGVLSKPLASESSPGGERGLNNPPNERPCVGEEAIRFQTVKSAICDRNRSDWNGETLLDVSRTLQLVREAKF